jgi:hypothetical protein
MLSPQLRKAALANHARTLSFAAARRHQGTINQILAASADNEALLGPICLLPARQTCTRARLREGRLTAGKCLPPSQSIFK